VIVFLSLEVLLWHLMKIVFFTGRNLFPNKS